MSDPRYSQVVEFLFRQLPMFQRVGAGAFKKDLTNIRALCSVLGHPEKKLKYVHIAGTNGKGSTTHILAALLQSQYDKIGLYTSPHFVDYRERIKIGGTYISEEDVIAFVDLLEPHLKAIQPSFFEITVAMAFWYFEKEKVDIAVIETGLGGRLDSTNVISPMLSIITNIGFDHMDFLGDTIQEIAREKAGIIKKGVPVLIGRRQRETSLIFKSFAQRKCSKIYWAEERVTRQSMTLQGQAMEYRFRLDSGQELEFTTDLTGRYQEENYKTALAAFDLLFPDALEQEGHRILFRLQSLTKDWKMMGRWQVVGNEPMVVLDGAHNREGWELISHQLKAMTYRKLIIVFGVVKDKNLSQNLDVMPRGATYIVCQAKIPRAMPVDELQHQLEAAQLETKLGGSIKASLVKAQAMAQPEDLILVTGSMFVVAEALV